MWKGILEVMAVLAMLSGLFGAIGVIGLSATEINLFWILAVYAKVSAVQCDIE